MNSDLTSSVITAILFFGIAALAARAASRRAPPAPPLPPDGSDRRATPRSTPDRRRAPERSLNVRLLIERCPDSMMWYAGLVGKTVPYVRCIYSEQLFMSREPEGYLNIVKMADARIVITTETTQ